MSHPSNFRSPLHQYHIGWTHRTSEMSSEPKMVPSDLLPQHYVEAPKINNESTTKESDANKEYFIHRCHEATRIFFPCLSSLPPLENPFWSPPPSIGEEMTSDIDLEGEMELQNTKKKQKKCRRKSRRSKCINYCSYCRNKGEPKEVFKSHRVRDSDGQTTCPALLERMCEFCLELGHTKLYCPMKKEFRCGTGSNASSEV